MAEPPYWDPYDTDLDDDPHPVWLRLRDDYPVYRNDSHDFYALSRFEDVSAASRDPAVFSSAHGTVLERMAADRTSTAMMIWLDPPEHTRLRSLVSRAFTPRRTSGLVGPIREICGELLDRHLSSDGFDYVIEFAAQVPSRVISTLVGVPAEDQEQQRRNVDGMFHIEPGVGMANQSAAESALALAVFLSDLASERERSPRDDLLSDLLAAEVEEDGERRRLTLDECVSFAVLLYTAGTETVAKLLGNAAVILAAHPDQRAQMAADPQLVPAAVEELLRYEPPSPVNGRWTTRSVHLHGTTIPADSKVLLLTGSAGRDERVYRHPDRFDIHRAGSPHVSFGYGIHFCVGAALARLEARVALEETLVRFPNWEADPGRLQRVHTSTVRGYSSVPISF